jgi:uncharacterized membrane protein SpoIIM required for sporulation
VAATLRTTRRSLILSVVFGYAMALLAGFLIAPWDLAPPDAPVRLAVFSTAGHNMEVIAILFLGGAALLVPTAIVGAWNGFITGSLLASLSAAPNWWIATLAHGMPESAAQCCAMVGGAELLFWLLGWLRGKDFSVPGRALTWAGLAVAGTLIAAYVEGTLSPVLVEILAP